jgi:hypothetical protein
MHSDLVKSIMPIHKREHVRFDHTSLREHGRREEWEKMINSRSNL